jgi:hypothetical protein
MPFYTANTLPASRPKAVRNDQARDIIRPPLLNIMGLKLTQLHSCDDARTKMAGEAF